MKMRKTTQLLCVILCLCVVLSACHEPADPTTVPTTQAGEAIYTITVDVAGGMVLEDIDLYVYEDSSKEDLLTFGSLDENGKFVFTAAVSDKYIVEFEGMPQEGYGVQASYPITGTDMKILLTPAVIKDADPTGKVYQLGDVMRDFTVTTTDGVDLTISEILKEKKAVALNFWYTGCGPCKNEFPLLQAAYEAYGDQIEVIAMDPTGESNEKIAKFKQDNGLTFPMAACPTEWINALKLVAYPTTVIIDRNGVICLIETGAVSEEGVFEGAFAHFTAEDYQRKLVKSMHQLGVQEYPLGHAQNPYQTNADADTFSVTVESGHEVHAVVYGATDGVEVRIEDPNAYIIYNGVRYDPNQDGVLTVNVVAADPRAGANIVIGNEGVTAATMQAHLILPRGTMTYPFDLVPGEVTVDVEAGNELGVYYITTAPGTGMMTVTITGVSTGVAYDVQIYNLTTMAMATLQGEGLTDKEGNPYVAVAVNAGDSVRISFHTLNEGAGYPAAKIQALVSSGDGADQKIPYSITVKDDAGKPVPNTTVSVIVDGVPTDYRSDAQGKILMELVSGNYRVTLTVPEDYTADITQYLLTPGNPDQEITLKRYVPQDLTYTVQVTDPNGIPLADIAVSVAGKMAWTDANGVAAFILQEGKYTATVIANGKSTNYDFGEETVLNVKLDNTATAEYTVHVVDVNGSSIKGVIVNFVHANGGSAALVDLNANGMASATLPKGEYTVELLFKDNAMGYDRYAAKLTAEITSATIEVAAHANGEEASVVPAPSTVPAPAYHVSIGGAYVSLIAEDVSYFLFTPVEPGVYEITTTNAAAQVENWNTFFDCQKVGPGVQNNVLTLEVYAAGSTYVIGIRAGSNVNGTILKIVRTGDVKKEPEQVTFQGTTVPTAPYVAELGENQMFHYLNLAEENVLVKDETTGFYHLGSLDGPVVMMYLNATCHGINLTQLVANGSMLSYEYDADGNIVKQIDYTDCMVSYVNCADETYGVYALTDDLMTILKAHGETAGWYDAGSDAYLFDGDTVLAGNEWMFLLCIVA